MGFKRLFKALMYSVPFNCFVLVLADNGATSGSRPKVHHAVSGLICKLARDEWRRVSVRSLTAVCMVDIPRYLYKTLSWAVTGAF